MRRGVSLSGSARIDSQKPACECIVALYSERGRHVVAEASAESFDHLGADRRVAQVDEQPGVQVWRLQQADGPGVGDRVGTQVEGDELAQERRASQAARAGVANGIVR